MILPNISSNSGSFLTFNDSFRFCVRSKWQVCVYDISKAFFYKSWRVGFTLEELSEASKYEPSPRVFFLTLTRKEYILKCNAIFTIDMNKREAGNDMRFSFTKIL